MSRTPLSMTTNISAENLAALNAARRSDGKFGSRPHAESDVNLTGAFPYSRGELETARPATARDMNQEQYDRYLAQRTEVIEQFAAANPVEDGEPSADTLNRLSEALEKYDRTPLEAEYGFSGRDTDEFTGATATWLKTDLVDMSLEAGELEAEEADDVRLHPDSEAKLREVTEKFMEDNAGDLQYMQEHSHLSLDSLGYDLYMSASRSGVDFTDRVSDPVDRIVAQRLVDTIHKDFPVLEHGSGYTEIGDDNQIHIRLKDEA